MAVNGVSADRLFVWLRLNYHELPCLLDMVPVLAVDTIVSSTSDSVNIEYTFNFLCSYVSLVATYVCIDV